MKPVIFGLPYSRSLADRLATLLGCYAWSQCVFTWEQVREEGGWVWLDERPDATAILPFEHELMPRGQWETPGRRRSRSRKKALHLNGSA